MLLEGKICLVTGASRGIGAAIVKRFADEGAVVYACSRSEHDGNAVDDRMFPGSIIPLHFDVTDLDGMKAAVMRVKKERGCLDVVVNNAGMMQDALIGMISHALMEQTFAVNVFAMIDLIQFAAKIMMRQKSGSIINLSSLVGVNGNSGQLVYSASKGAVISLTKSAAKELAPSNIRVNAVAPGMIETDLFLSIGEKAIAEFSSRIGMGHVGSPEEVADVCVFLGSDYSRYVTGQVIGVDGSALM